MLPQMPLQLRRLVLCRLTLRRGAVAQKADAFAPHWRYNALKDTGNDQVLNFSGWDFNGDINSPKGVQIVVREKGSNTPVLAY